MRLYWAAHGRAASRTKPECRLATGAVKTPSHALNTRTESSPTDIIRLSFDDSGSLVLEVSPWILGAVLILVGVGAIQWWRTKRRFSLVSLDILLGGIGKVQLRPHEEDLNVAHKIWTELVTRKAAIPFDPTHDVLAEVYDSWYELFGRVRDLIARLPARLVREDPGTQELVRIATESLNRGLRPHLTRWQACFRNWYANQTDDLKTRTPQEVQRDFPDYEKLVADLKVVNEGMIQYAGELQKLVRGK